MVDLPEPEGPTMAVESPAFSLKLAPCKIGLCSGDAVGYLKVTFSNEM